MHASMRWEWRDMRTDSLVLTTASRRRYSWPRTVRTSLREAILACRNGGTVSVPGVYGGFLDKIPFGAIVNRALTIKSGQTHVQRYLRPLLDLIEQGRIDPSFVVSHRLPLEEAPVGFRMFRDKQQECTKIVLKPGTSRSDSDSRTRLH